MTAISDDLLAMLTELAECQGSVYEDQYNAAERAKLKSLRQLGLVEKAWVLTGKGKKFLEDRKGG